MGELRLGFTGSRLLTPRQESFVAQRLDRLCTEATHVITGACVGVDSFIARYVDANFPDILNVIVVPSRQDRVCHEVLKLTRAMRLHMPYGTSYRDRNEKIVDLSDEVHAFYCSQSRGTFMTIAIAKKAQKIRDEWIYQLP